MKIAIIGAGPGGYVAAIRAARMGADITLVERDRLGGVCLNEGCIPTKALHRHAALLRDIRRAADFGIDIPAWNIDYARMVQRKDRVVEQLRTGVEGLLKQSGARVVKGRAMIENEHAVRVGDELIACDAMIIATGSEAVIPPIQGAELAITSRELLSMTVLPQSMIVIGGGVIGVEVAGIYRAFGCGVRMIEMQGQILPTMDSEAATLLTKHMKADGVEIHTGTKVESIVRDGTSLIVQAGGNPYRADCVLMAIGRRAVLPESRLELAYDGNALAVDSRLRTNCTSIYCIGDANGKYQLAHVASAEGLVAVDNILGAEREMDYKTVPSVVYSFPEIASVGIADKGVTGLSVGKFPHAACGKALAMGEPEGFAKVLTSPPYGEIVGAHVIGADAANIIAEMALALKLEATAEEVADTIHAHPSISEVLLEACEAVLGRPVHIM